MVYFAFLQAKSPVFWDLDRIYGSFSLLGAAVMDFLSHELYEGLLTHSMKRAIPSCSGAVDFWLSRSHSHRVGRLRGTAWQKLCTGQMFYVHFAVYVMKQSIMIWTWQPIKKTSPKKQKG